MTVKGQFSMNPTDSGSETDGGKPIGNENEFPVGTYGEAGQREIDEVNTNRNDITQRAARELVRIAREVMSEERWEHPTSDRRLWRRRKQDGTYEYRETPPEEGSATSVVERRQFKVFEKNPFQSLGRGDTVLWETPGTLKKRYDRTLKAKWKQQDASVKHLAKKHGMSEEEVRQKADAHVQGILSRARVAIRVPSETVEEIVRSGGVKKAYEIHGAGRDPHYMEERDYGEAMTMGIPVDVDPKLRPVYGYLTDIDRVQDEDAAWPVGNVTLRRYGDAKLILKPSVRGRTSAVVGDTYVMSQGDMEKPSPMMVMPLEKAGLAITDSQDSNGEGYDPFEDEHPSVTSLVSDTPRATAAYVEAHVHGGVRLEDIEEVVFSSEPSDDVKEALQRAGIRFSVS
jgi:hypothetical protein